MSGGDLFDFLENGFYYQPNIRLPFPVFLVWVQLELSKGNYEFASECLIKPYIQKSNCFQGESMEQEKPSDASNSQFEQSSSQVSSSRPWLRGQGARTFGMSKSGFGSSDFSDHSDKLPLSNPQYYQLLELLVFHVYLPSKGMSFTLSVLNDELPMKPSIKNQFI